VTKFTHVSEKSLNHTITVDINLCTRNEAIWKGVMSGGVGPLLLNFDNPPPPSNRRRGPVCPGGVDARRTTGKLMKIPWTASTLTSHYTTGIQTVLPQATFGDTAGTFIRKLVYVILIILIVFFIFLAVFVYKLQWAHFPCK
jgi:hypothetical protein